jgi:hypothetical protein
VDADLSAIYTEAIDMAQVALDALNNYATSATVRASVQTFFGIKADSSSPTTVAASDAIFFQKAKSMLISVFQSVYLISMPKTGISFMSIPNALYPLFRGDMNLKLTLY